MAETEYTPFGSEPDAVPVRLIVRRVKPKPGYQLALFTTYSYHAFITDREGDTLNLEADPIQQWGPGHAEIENAIRDPASSAGQALKYGVGLNHLPSGRFPANPPLADLAGRPEPAPYSIRGHGPSAFGGARWTTRIGLGEPVATTIRQRRSGGASSPWPDGSPARHAALLCTFPKAGPGKTISAAPWRDRAPCHSRPDRSLGV